MSQSFKHNKIYLLISQIHILILDMQGLLFLIVYME